MTYLLALDQGTSSSRSIVFDANGRTVAGEAADNDSGGNADDPRNGDTP